MTAGTPNTISSVSCRPTEGDFLGPLTHRPKIGGFAIWLEHLIQVVQTQDHTYWAIKASDSDIKRFKQAEMSREKEKLAKWIKNQQFFQSFFT